MFPAALNTCSDGVLVAQMHFKQPQPGILPHYSTTKQAGLRWPPLTNSNWKWLLRSEVLAHLTLNARRTSTAKPVYTGRDKATIKNHLNFVSARHKTRHQFTVGDLSCRAAPHPV